MPCFWCLLVFCWPYLADTLEELVEQSAKNISNKTALGNQSSIPIWFKKSSALEEDSAVSFSTSSSSSPNSSGVSVDRRLDHVPSATPVLNFPSIETWAGGRQGSGTFELHTPYSAYVTAQGDLYVSDTKNHRVQLWKTPLSTQALGSTPQTVAGGGGRGRDFHQLRFPKGIHIDSIGNLYIADSGNHRIIQMSLGSAVGTVVAGEYRHVTDKHGNIMSQDPFCCEAGYGHRHLNDPHDVFVDTAGRIYVADTGNNRIQSWYNNVASTVAGGSIAAASSSNINASLKEPESMFVKDGIIYVADTGHDRVMAWGSGATVGTLVAGGRGRGSALDQLVNPSSVWVDDSLMQQGTRIKRLFVCDLYNNRIMRYLLTGVVAPDTSPQLVAGGCLQNPPYINPCIHGGLHYPRDPAHNRVDQINPSNTNPPVYHFWGPTDIFVGPGGRNLTITDALNHRVVTWIDHR